MPLDLTRPGVNRRSFLLAASAMIAAPAIARADSALPNAPIRVVVPYAAGGSSDIAGRLVAQEFSQLLNRNFFVENRPGGATMIGTEAAARAKPDGTTLLIGTTATVTSPLLMNSPFDARRELMPVGQVLEAPMMFVAHPSFGPRTVADIIAEAKAKPGALNISHPGNGSANHIALELFTRAAGIEVTLIPFTGNAPSLAAVTGGHVQLALDAVLSSRSLVESKQLRAIAVTSKTRFPTMPDVPPIAETGLPGFDVTFWSSVLAPAKTPQPMIDEMNAALRSMLARQDVIERLLALGAEARPGSPADLAALINANHERWGAVIREAKLRIE